MFCQLKSLSSNFVRIRVRVFAILFLIEPISGPLNVSKFGRLCNKRKFSNALDFNELTFIYYCVKYIAIRT